MGLSSERVTSFDFTKGFSILYVASIHIGMYWASASWEGHFFAYYMLSDFFGPILFISMSILGTFASRFRMEQKNEFVKTDYRKHLLVRSSYLLIIGTIYNVGFDAYNGFQEGAWALVKMTIFSAVVISQAITYAMHGARARTKAIALIVLLVIKVPIERMTTLATGASVTASTLQTVPGILYFLLFVGNPIGLLDTIIITFAVVLTANMFVKSIIQFDAKERKLASRKVVLFSIALILASIVAGGFVMSNEQGEAAKFLWYMGSVWPSDAIPLFLVRHSSWNLMFKVGVVLSVIVLLYYIIDMKGRSSTRVVKRVATCGVYSFSIYVYHNLTAFVSLDLNWYEWVIASLLEALAFIVIINVWNDKLGGVGSFEWGARQWAMLFRQKKRAAPLLKPEDP
jgi:hypothetical protein